MSDVAEMAARLGDLDRVFFNHDIVSKVLTKIRTFHLMSNHSDKSKMMLLYGLPGVGKTTMIEYYLQHDLLKQQKLHGGTEYLYVSLPAKCTHKNLASAILSALGDPLANRGTSVEMTRRAAAIIERKRITLVALDEFQHLIDRDNAKVIYSAADWLKGLANTVTCAFLLSGLPTLTNVIGANEQLERRVTTRVDLRAFEYSTKSEVILFDTLLAMFADELPFKNSDIIVNSDMALAIHQATRGRVGLVVRLIQSAGLFLLSSGQASLSVEAFAEAFTMLSTGEKKDEFQGILNPFLKMESVG